MRMQEEKRREREERKRVEAVRDGSWGVGVSLAGRCRTSANQHGDGRRCGYCHGHERTGWVPMMFNGVLWYFWRRLWRREM